MSKLSQLKQKAYQAGKSRNWELAISIYEQILEVEKSNPTVINELGDLCLKSGDTRSAIKHFLSSATKYRKTGLLNNSVAICKKILRHDEAIDTQGAVSFRKSDLRGNPITVMAPPCSHPCRSRWHGNGDEWTRRIGLRQPDP